MLKKYSIPFAFLLSSFFSLGHAENSSTMSVSSSIEKTCVLELPSLFDFGTVDFSTLSTATVIPTNYAPFREMPFNLKLKCSPEVSSSITYRTEMDLSPSGITIEGIKMLNPLSNDPLDRFNAYIYNTSTATMLHSLKKPLFYTGTGNWHAFDNLYLGLQNPFSRGYISPVPGVYTGTSELFVTF